MAMNVIGWMALGLIVGFITTKLTNARGEGRGLNILLGIVGAVVSGWIFRGVGTGGVSGFNIWSLPLAVIGALVVLVIWHGMRTTSHA